MTALEMELQVDPSLCCHRCPRDQHEVADTQSVLTPDVVNIYLIRFNQAFCIAFSFVVEICSRCLL